MLHKNFTEENLKPNRILHYIVDNGFDSEKDYTYIVCGRSGPTGKTWLWNGLKHYGFNAIEISEDVISLISYQDNKNHFIVNERDKCVLIILNEPLKRT